MMFPAVPIALSMMLCATAVSAQGAPPSLGHATYGFMAGANFAKLAGSDVQDAKIRTGLVAGAYAAWPLAPGWSVQPEVLYSMEGAKASDQSAQVTVKLDYIGVPVLFRYSPSTSSSAKPFIAAGPAFGYQLSCNISASSGGISASSSCDDAAQGSTDFQRKKFAVSGRVEAGIDVATKSARLRFGGAYSHGFTDVVSDSNGKNRVFSLFVGIGV